MLFQTPEGKVVTRREPRIVMVGRLEMNARQLRKLHRKPERHVQKDRVGSEVDPGTKKVGWLAIQEGKEEQEKAKRNPPPPAAVSPRITWPSRPVVSRARLPRPVPPAVASNSAACS